MKDRNELLDMLDNLVEQLGMEQVLKEIVLGLHVEELEFQLDEIVRLYDLGEAV